MVDRYRGRNSSLDSGVGYSGWILITDYLEALLSVRVLVYDSTAAPHV